MHATLSRLDMRTTSMSDLLGILTFLQVVWGISGGDELCAFDFTIKGRYAFSHLAEESPMPEGLPEGMDYHVRDPIQ